MGKSRNNKQYEIYNFIKKMVHEKGYPPSIREICAAVGLSSTSTVYGHLLRLQEKGLIKKDPTKPRAIEIIEEMDNRHEMLDIPVIGNVAAGVPILAVENIEDTFSVPVNYVDSKEDLFILKVCGESMIDVGILNGDLVIIEKCNTALNGEIIVALIDNEATLKRFYKEDNLIRLQPENKSMKPIYVKDCKILGKLVALYRKY